MVLFLLYNVSHGAAVQVLQGEAGIEAVPMQSIKSIQEALRMCTALYQELSTQAAQPSLSPAFPGAASAAQGNGALPP